MSRKLLSTRRTVAEAVSRYMSAWNALRTYVEEQGAHAWLFQADDNPHIYMEFIEWKPGTGNHLLDDQQLIVLRRALDQFGPSTDDLWTQPKAE